jgi:hypothetical protein
MSDVSFYSRGVVVVVILGGGEDGIGWDGSRKRMTSRGFLDDRDGEGRNLLAFDDVADGSRVGEYIEY